MVAPSRAASRGRAICQASPAVTLCPSTLPRPARLLPRPARLPMLGLAGLPARRLAVAPGRRRRLAGIERRRLAVSTGLTGRREPGLRRGRLALPGAVAALGHVVCHVSP